MVLFTPLSIRRGGGGEAVDWLVGSLFRLGVRLPLHSTSPLVLLSNSLGSQQSGRTAVPPFGG